MSAKRVGGEQETEEEKGGVMAVQGHWGQGTTDFVRVVAQAEMSLTWKEKLFKIKV